jgi:hypothetical protein
MTRRRADRGARMTIKVSNYRDVSQFGVDPDKLERVLAAQTEAVVMWTTADGWPVGVMHRFVWHDSRFWVTCAEHRKRVKALRTRPKSAISVSSEGTSLGADINIVAKTLAVVHGDDDRAIKSWFFDALADRQRPDEPEAQAAFVSRLDHPGRVVIELVPQAWISYDGNRLNAALLGDAYDPAATKPSVSR